MSLVVVVKGAESIVLAADSRVTLNTQQPGGGLLKCVHFDTKNFAKACLIVAKAPSQGPQLRKILNLKRNAH